MTNRIAIDRIRFFLGKLSSERTTRDDRLTCWRLIISASHDAREKELAEMESLMSVVADPTITEAAGGIVG